MFLYQQLMVLKGNTALHLSLLHSADLNGMQLLQRGAQFLLVNKDGKQPFCRCSNICKNISDFSP
jgi:hypothetical protein